MNREQATNELRSMTFEECINFCDEVNCDHYNRFVEIHEMSDEEWWNDLAEEYGTWQLMIAVLSSGEAFNATDKFFFFNTEEERVYSFSTKQELTELMTEDWFIDNLMNREI